MSQTQFSLSFYYSILSFGQFLGTAPVSPLGLTGWGISCFYTHAALLGLPSMPSTFLFLRVAFVSETVRKTIDALKTEQETYRNCPNFRFNYRLYYKM